MAASVSAWTDHSLAHVAATSQVRRHFGVPVSEFVSRLAALDTRPNSSRGSHGVDSAALNHGARILGGVSADVPADAALRHYFLETRHLGPREKRTISRLVSSAELAAGS